MINSIKMELYRLFHMRILYVMWIVLFFATIGCSCLNYNDYISLQNNSVISNNAEIIIGLGTTLPTKAGELISIYDSVYANLQGKFTALFLVVAAVFFAGSDFSGGFIKEIAGQARHIEYLLYAKAIVLFVYTVLSLGVYFISQVAANGIVFGYVIFGDFRQCIIYISIEAILYYILMLVCLMITVIFRIMALSLTIGICLCINVHGLLFRALDAFILNLAGRDLNLMQYTIAGKISLLSMNIVPMEIVTAIIMAIVYGMGAIFVSILLYRKRDVC